MEVTSIRSFVDYWQRIHSRTARVIQTVPPDKMEWRPTPDAFSFGDLIRHLAAIERYMFTENVSGRWSSYPGHAPEIVPAAAGLLSWYESLHAQSVEIVSHMSDSDLQLPCTTPGGVTMSRAKWLRSMIEHEAHHRGQIYLMLKLIGVASPPLYGLTSEEVFAKSQQP